MLPLQNSHNTVWMLHTPENLERLFLFYIHKPIQKPEKYDQKLFIQTWNHVKYYTISYNIVNSFHFALWDCLLHGGYVQCYNVRFLSSCRFDDFMILRWSLKLDSYFHVENSLHHHLAICDCSTRFLNHMNSHLFILV